MISIYQIQTNWNLQPKSLSTQETWVREKGKEITLQISKRVEIFKC